MPRLDVPTPHRGVCEPAEGSSQGGDELTNLNLSHIQRVHSAEFHDEPKTRILVCMIVTPNQLDCRSELAGSMLTHTHTNAATKNLTSGLLHFVCWLVKSHTVSIRLRILVCLEACFTHLFVTYVCARVWVPSSGFVQMVDPAEVAALIGQTASYEPLARNYSDFPPRIRSNLF